MVTKDDLIIEIRMYLKHIKYAHDYYFAYKILSDAKGEEAFSHKIYYANSFFSIVHKALLDSLFMELSKLYSKSRYEEKSIWKLIDKLESNSKIFGNISTVKDDIGKLKEQLNKVVPITDQIILKRDKLIAHNDKITFLNPEEFKKNIIVFEHEIYNLIHITGKFCNKILTLLGEEEQEYVSKDAEDLIKLLIKCE